MDTLLIQALRAGPWGKLWSLQLAFNRPFLASHALIWQSTHAFKVIASARLFFLLAVVTSQDGKSGWAGDGWNVKGMRSSFAFVTFMSVGNLYESRSGSLVV